MPTIAFFPWLRLRSSIRLGRFHAFPHGVGDELPDDVEHCVSKDSITKVLSLHHVLPAEPVQVVTMLQVDGKPVGSELTEDDRAAVFKFGQYMAVSCMAERRFIGGFPDDFTSSGHYQVVVQDFPEPFAGNVTMTFRRKGGHVRVMMASSSAQILMPPHLIQLASPEVNLPLLRALDELDALPTKWPEHVQASLAQYLLANSDSPDVSLEAESTATYAALERVSNSDQKLSDAQKNVGAILAIAKEAPLAAEFHRELATGATPVFNSWLKGLYQLRGNTGHGKPGHLAPQDWSMHEHLVAGAFVYPLVLKCLFARHSMYDLTDEDIARVVGLDMLLGDRPFYPVGKSDEPLMHSLIGLPHQGWVAQFQRIGEVLMTRSLRR